VSCTALTLGFSAEDFLKLEKNLIKEINYTALMATTIADFSKIINAFTIYQIPTVKTIDDFYKTI
jgi:hypothetical protein